MTTDRDELAQMTAEALEALPAKPSSTALPLMMSDEHDDRFDHVTLLWISDEGDYKRTARRSGSGDGWTLAEWETYDLEGQFYWVCTWSFTICDADLNNLRALSATT